MFQNCTLFIPIKYIEKNCYNIIYIIYNVVERIGQKKKKIEVED